MSMQFLAWEVSADYYTRPPGIVSLLILTITYKQSSHIHIYTHRVGSINIQCIALQDPGRDTSAEGVLKIGNIVPRVGIKHTSVAFQVRVLTITPPRFPYVTTVPTPTCLCSSLPERSVHYKFVLGVGPWSINYLYSCLYRNHWTWNELPIMPRASSYINWLRDMQSLTSGF